MFDSIQEVIKIIIAVLIQNSVKLPVTISLIV